MVKSPPMENRATPRFYLPELDGLRFIAFLLVFVHNAPHIESNKIWTAFHEYGWIGVDLFFCLSAFLITKLLISEYKQTGDVNIRNFYFRRILRIWPLYFFYILISSIFIAQNNGWDVITTQHMAGIITFTYNFVYLFLTHKMYFVLFHLWTISYEEQFYAFIPWTIKKLASGKNIAKFMLATLLVGSAIRAILIYYQAKHPIIYMLPFTHFEAVLCGVVIASGVIDKFFEKVKPNWNLIVGLLLNALAFLLPNTYEIGWGLMLTYPLVGFGMAFVLYGLIRKSDQKNYSLLKTKPLVYLGKISFGLYIYHLLSISIVGNFFNHNIDGLMQHYTIILFISSLVLTVLFSALSYKLLEKPFLKFKERYSPILSRPA